MREQVEAVLAPHRAASWPTARSEIDACQLGLGASRKGFG
jgi:hypothetical protein